MSSLLTDNYNRHHTYLRISLTDNCNLRCFYCMPEEEYEFTPTSKLMQPAEILHLAKIFVALGVTKIRLTGGEPLVRKEVKIILYELGKLPVELSITTNATRVHHFIDDLQVAGIRNINVSLDTLLEDRFTLLTRRNQFQQVWDNVFLLMKKGFFVKLNVVVMRGINDDELHNFVALTKDLPLEVRFIEFMPFEGNRWSSNKVFTWQDMLDSIEQRFIINALPGAPSDTSKRYQVQGHVGHFAVISTMSSHFCNSCNRLRLTADGKLKNCLFSRNETDLLTPMRNGIDVRSLIAGTVKAKEAALGGQFSADFTAIQPEQLSNRSMITIGG